MRFVLPILAVFALLAVSFAAVGNDIVKVSCEPPAGEAPFNLDLDGDLDEALGAPLADLCVHRPVPLERISPVVSLGGQPEASGIFRPPQRSGA